MADKDYPYTSLCMVTEIKRDGLGILKRLADIKDDKIQSQFIGSAPIREKLLHSNCTLPVNFIGIFDWRTEPKKINKNDDYIDSRLCNDKVPIEIFILENCAYINDLRNKLLNGIQIDFPTERALIVYRLNCGVYRGVLCTEDNFKKDGDKKKITAISLPVFEIRRQNFVRFEGRIFYSELNPDSQAGIFHTKTLDEVIKGKIVSRIRQTNFKNKFSEPDLQNFRKFVKNFSAGNFYSEIAKEYSITSEEAKKYVDKFVKECEQYLRSEFFEDKVFSNIIQHCPSLMEKSRQLAAEQWQADNQEKISAANLELSKIQQKIDSELKTCVELEEETKIYQDKLDELLNEIKQRKELAAEVENKIAERIETARKNVADFICEMAFVNPNFSGVQTSKNNFYRAGKIIEGKEIEIIEDLEDFLYTLETELGVVGTQNENILPFAAYLIAAYMNKILLLLAGPNARDIADAFSVTLTGKTAAIFDCVNINSFSDLKIISDSDDEIIAVLNPFAPNFIAYLPELVNIKEKFIFAIYPFAEDLRMEPRSFYNYFLPIFTELIIDRPPARKFFKYLLPEKLKQELQQKYNPDEVSISADKRMKKLKKDMREFLQEKKSVELFADFPLAYVKGQEEKFMADFKGDEKIIEKIREFLGEDA